MTTTIRVEGKNYVLDNYAFNNEQKYLLWKSSTGEHDINVNVKLPFNVEDKLAYVFQPAKDIDRVLLFRNPNFAERNIVRLKISQEGSGSKNVGFVFSLSTIFDLEGIHKENEHVRPYMVRAILALMFNRTGFTPEVKDFRADSDYSLADFFPNDIQICIISKDLLRTYDDDIETSLLYHLNLYGFYYLGSNEHKDYYPDTTKTQKEAFNSLLDPSGNANILFKLLNTELKTEEYIKKYIRELINTRQDYLSRFLLAYQIFELLIDKVTKLEINKKIITNPFILNERAFKIKGILTEITSESYRMKLVFNKYCKFRLESDYQVCFDILELFQKNLEVSKSKEDSEDKEYGSYFYLFRNMVVHNTKIMYSGTEADIHFKSASLSAIVLGTEFLVAEAVTSFTDPTTSLPK